MPQIAEILPYEFPCSCNSGTALTLILRPPGGRQNSQNALTSKRLCTLFMQNLSKPLQNFVAQILCTHHFYAFQSVAVRGGSFFSAYWFMIFGHESFFQYWLEKIHCQLHCSITVTTVSKLIGLSEYIWSWDIHTIFCRKIALPPALLNHSDNNFEIDRAVRILMLSTVLYILAKMLEVTQRVSYISQSIRLFRSQF